MFLDIGLAQAMLGFDNAAWILDPQHAFVNAGELAESFVGQELLAYATPHVSPALYLKDSPVNGTSSPAFRSMSDS